MADKNYHEARATKDSKERDVNFNFSKSKTKKYARKIKKSVILTVIAVSMIIGAVIGFFAANSLNKFYMNDFYVAGVKAQEADYIEVDVSKIRESLENGTASSITMEQVYNAASLTDEGVTIKFLGINAKNSVTTKYFYREDISHDIQEVSGIDVSVPGVYYIEYTSSHFAFKNTTLIRTVIVTGVEVDG